MNRDFFEALTDPNATRLPRPLTPEEMELAYELQPALSLLSKAGPTNGINLVPAWQEFLAAEMACAPEVPAAPHSAVTMAKASSVKSNRSWLFWASYAAVLVLGVGVGVLGTSAFRSKAAGFVEKNHYSAEQRQWMMALLEANSSVDRDTIRTAAAELSGCVTCHAALKQRIAAPAVSSDLHRSFPKMTDWATLLAVKAIDLVESNGKT
jgi:hypothetical protein